jgi:hypothetical protein
MANTTVTDSISIKQDAAFGQGFANQDGDFIANASYTETASTGTNLKHYGITEITSTAAKSYTIDAPVPGCYKEIVNAAGTTTINTVVFGSTVNGIQVGGLATHRKITFNAQNESVVVKGISTTKWLVTALNGATIASS